MMGDACAQLHQFLMQLERFRFPFEPHRIPRNGIYVLFEAGERAHGGDRIVRVGTHTGAGQLRSRLRQHFVQENKDRSIFRKNIGRALLNRANDPLCAQWEIDRTSRAVRIRYEGQLDLDRLREVEIEVSSYIRQYFSFVVLSVSDKAERLWLESKLISTVSLCDVCRPSAAWLGLASPKEKIQTSGLWLVNELYKAAFSEQELTDFLARW